MKKALKFLLYTLLAVAALIAVLGLFAKKNYHVERSIEIDASRALVYDFVSHFNNFDQWSPWAALDPEMKTTVTGTDGTVGAVYAWNGNDNVGEGSQIITDLSPERIGIKTEFLRPFKSSSPTAINLKPVGNKTQVTWEFDMHAPFPLNAFMMFTDVDAAIGKDYEMGLENLRRVLEEIALKKYQGFTVEKMAFPPRTYMGIRQQTDSVLVAKVFAAGMTKIMKSLGATPLSGAPVGVYWTWANGKTDMAVAVPATQPVPAGLATFDLGGGTAYVIECRGDYAQLGQAHFAMDEYMVANKLVSIAPAIEEYLVAAPAEPDTAKWLTKVIYFAEPLK